MSTNYPMYPNNVGYPNYNNYYNPYIQTAYQPQPQTQQVQTNSVQRKVDIVQGRASAEIYNVNAGEEIFLLDMDNPYIYRKARGFDNKLEPMETYDIILHQDDIEQKGIDLSGYITNEQMENIISNEIEQRIKDEVDKRLSEISFAPTTITTKPSRKKMNKVEE